MRRVVRVYQESWRLARNSCAATADLSKESCAAQCLHAIAILHRNRIFRRLGFSKAKRSKKESSYKAINISARIRSLATEMREQANGRLPDSGAELLAQVDDLSTAIAACESTDDPGELSSIESLLRAAFEVTSDGVSLIPRLREFGIEDRFFQKAEIRQIQALGNYWRICRYFSCAARSFRPEFRSTQLTALHAPSITRWRGHQHSVHAEIQILISLEMQQSQQKPRYIGTSKQPCFLCYHFLRAHGRYAVTRTHGEVHPKWTVPVRHREIISKGL